MNCPDCGAENPDYAEFCIECGAKLPQGEGRGKSPYARGVFFGFADQVSRVAGVETPTEIGFRQIFSRVFQKHSEEEAEALFAMGTAESTPDLYSVSETWPKPWLFARVLFGVFVLYIGFYIGLVYFQNFNFLPGLIIIGAIATPISLVVFFWEMNVPQNISMYKLISVFLAGGLASLLFTVVLYSAWQDGGGTLAATVTIGLTEEAGKVLAVLLFIRNRRYTFLLNGLLIGAAIGAGFATFETAGYILNAALSGQGMFLTTFLRALLAPGGHIAWASLSGAALYRVKGPRKFTFGMLKDFRFLRVFLLVVALHALWDAPIPQPFLDGIPVYQILLTVISWIVVFSFLNAGLRQIAWLKSRYVPPRSSDV